MPSPFSNPRPQTHPPITVPTPPVSGRTFTANAGSVTSDITASELAALLHVNVTVESSTYNSLPAGVQRHFKQN